MRSIGLFVTLAVPFTAVAAARPRGVGPEFGAFYKDVDTFMCISGPAVRIPIAQVNDDYCDCPDGSDEPGTSACSFLSPLSPSYPSDPTAKDTINVSAALPGFYCKNKGHKPAYLPFQRVNDGVCDYSICCDGSDEWADTGKTMCENRCETIGKEARELAVTRQKALGEAGKARKDLVLQAGRIKKSVEEEIAILDTKIAAGQVTVTNAEKELAEIERKEKGRLISGATNAKAGKLGVLVSLAQKRTTELREHLIRVRGERDASVDRINELEKILSTFKDEYNPNFNDEGVKRAVRAWEDYAAREKSELRDTARDQDLEYIQQPDEENGVAWEEFTADDDDDADTDLLYSFEAYLPPSLRTWLSTSLSALRVRLVDAGVLPAPRTADGSPESRAVTDAKTRLSSAQSQLSTWRSEHDAKEADLRSEYGADEIFRALKGQCINVESGEYIYDMCFMSHTAQKSRKTGGGETRMGNFVRFDTVAIDEEDDVGGLGGTVGMATGSRLGMRFENGQTCWNGPARSTLVVLYCSAKNELRKVVEEEKCVYRMDVGTPAVCDAPGGIGGLINDGLRDEL